jgi:glutathione peroxidase
MIAPMIARRSFLAGIAALAGAPALAEASRMTAHAFSFTSIDGAPLSLADWRGRPVLVVNTASFCGFTPQYQGLEALWRKYKDRGLVVLGVPSNDFGRQEPGSAKEIKEFCEANYDVDFPLTEKQKVVGPEAHPFYRWVVAELGEGAAPRWNFHKYLIDRSAREVLSFDTRVAPSDPKLVAALERMLSR